MHASQRIWDALVKEGMAIDALLANESCAADVARTGFTREELERVVHFAEFRRALLARSGAYPVLVAAARAYLEAQADQRLRELSALEPAPAGPSDTEEAEGETAVETASPAAETAARGADDGARAVAALTDRDRQNVAILRESLPLPRGWDGWDARRRRQWGRSQRSRLRRARRQIARASARAASSFIAHELMGNEHVAAIGIGESDIRAYVHGGRFQRFPEDRNAWNRVALARTELQGPSGGSAIRTLDVAIASAAEAEGGWALSLAEYEHVIRDYLRDNPEATDEDVVRHAARHNSRTRGRDYPDRIWRHFQRLRETIEVTTH
jgi:hypothetical protein